MRTWWVALLRGVNVGGKNRLPMTDLVALFAGAGAADVRSYIQSGNVVFRASTAAAARVPGLVTRAIEKNFGFRPPLVLRSAGELEAVTLENPFLRTGANPDELHVLFLADKPDPARAAALDPGRSPPDTFVVRGREVYLRCPNGLARTRLTNDWFDRALDTVSTARNWRTVLKLAGMMTG